MQDLLRSIPSMTVSFVLHIIIVIVLLWIPLSSSGQSIDLAIETIFTERLPDQKLERDLDVENTPAETLNVIAGGTPSTNIGAAAQPVTAPVDIQKSQVMQEANIRPVLADLPVTGDDELAMELGEGEVTGEIGAIVEGYGNAMGIITQEIIRMMRQQKVTVIWLFDESESLEDDRQEIRENYLRVYEELGIAAQQDERLRRGSELLLTVVAGYGETIHELTPRPTADIKQIQQAIDRVPTDPSGKENMCQSVAAILSRYSPQAKRARRKLALIVVSDESGDDGEFVEEAILAAREAESPIYVMGRESMFGYPYARQRWVHEPSGEEFWLQVRRGPETAFPEALQWNGIQSRWDAQNSGFGPYEQVRMARETGGIFFVLPGEEANLVGRDAVERRKYDFLAMREYQPLALSRRQYVQTRAGSVFRDTVWNVISRLNPNDNKLLFQSHDPQLNIRREHYPIDYPGFEREMATQVVKVVRSLTLLNEAIQALETIQPLRAGEESSRWRASYDLATAQCYMFRLRLYQFLLTVDEHVGKRPEPNNEKSNEWNVWRARRTIVPDDAQFGRLKTSFGLEMERDEYIAMVRREEKETLDRLRAVIKNHPETPWARRAQREVDDGFGFRVAERHWDPQGVRATISRNLPNL